MFLFFFESSTPCLALENSSRSGYTRPPSKKIEPRYSVSLPDFTQASISGWRSSLTHSRAACSVRTMNSYAPVSAARSDPAQRIENSMGVDLVGHGRVGPEIEVHLRIDPLERRGDRRGSCGR